MPLSALIDGELVCAPLLPAARWTQLRGRRVTLQPCGHRGFGRVSALGTPHFVHERDSDCHVHESAEHLHLKAVIAQAVAAAGWSAGTEVAGEGFVADVLAVQQSHQVAFEVQRSRQVLGRYRERQDIYARAGVRAVWLVASVPAGHREGAELPLFLVRDWLTAPAGVVVGRSVPLPALVGALLAGRCHWRPSVPVTRELIDWLRVVCPMCGAVQRAVVQRWVQGRCGCGLPATVPAAARPFTPRRCCGYWGSGVGVEMVRAGRAGTGDVPLGHWCLSA